MHINLDHARCFCSLIESGSYQAAAKLLHRSHSSIVYAMGCFEKQCGIKLLKRSEYRTSLTEAGHRVYQQCRRLLDSSLDLEKLCSDLSNHWEPTVKLVYDGVLSPEPFLQIFKFFKDEKIPTRLDVYSDYLNGVEKTFIELEAQFMISILPVKQNKLSFIELKPISNTLVAHKNHELIKTKKTWTLNELKTFNFFTVRGADKSLNLGTKELEETSTFHLSDFSLKKTAILKGDGFGWLPEYMIEQELKKGILKPILWESSNRQELYPKIYFKKHLGKASEIILDRLSKGK